MRGNRNGYCWINSYSMGFKKRREKGLEEIRQQDLASPKGEGVEEHIGVLLRQRFAKLHERQRMQVIRNALSNLFGRHHAVTYRPQFLFRQRWEETRQSDEGGSRYSFLRSQNYLLNIIYFTVFFLYGVMLWFLSIYRLLALNHPFRPLLLLASIACLSDAVMRFLHYKQEHKGNVVIGVYLKRSYRDVLLVGYFCWLLVEDILWEDKSFNCLPLDVVLLVIGYQRFQEMFAGIKIAILSSHYRYQMQILQLVCGCLLQVHLFSLLLFSASRINQQSNWTLSISNFQFSWGTRYVYSLYFTCTTMFTVGYGDITPKNLVEIGAIMMIQVIGIINLGYIINQIGRFLSKINQGQQVLYRNISAAQKVIDTYKLPNMLASRMRNYLIENTLDVHEVNLQEEEHLLKRLNQDIRGDIDAYHKLQSVKTSIFFICQWSKKFKQRIAQNLVKVIYTPQETLTQVHGKEKLFLLVSGRLDVGICMQSKAGNLVKSMRVLSINPTKEVQSNVYGYSSLVSGLKVRLQAVAKDYCICYTIGRQKMLEIAAESQRDYEYLHVIKSKIECSKIRQEWQAPQVLNTREHYSPNPYYVLKKARLHPGKRNRRYIFRHNKRTTFIIQSQFIQTENQLSCSQDQPVKRAKTTDILSKGQRRVKYDQVIQAKNLLISTRDYRHKLKKKQQPLSQEQQLRRAKQQVLNAFEEGKFYKEYFPKWNRSQAVSKFNKAGGCQKESLQQTKKLLNVQITQQAVMKLMNIKSIASSHLE